MCVQGAVMEQGADGRVNAQLYSEMTIKTEVEETVQSSAHINTEINVSHVKEVPGVLQFVKRKIPLLVKEEVLEESRQDGNEQQCVQGASTPTGTDRVNEASSSSPSDLLHVKYELGDMDTGPPVHMDMHYTINEDLRSQLMPHTSKSAIIDRIIVAADNAEQGQLRHIKEQPEDADLDIGPTVLLHMDSHYRSNQMDLNIIKQENTISSNAEEVLPRIKNGQEVHRQVRDETIEDCKKNKDNKTISCKHIDEMTTERDDYGSHLKSCPRQQKDLQKHHQRQHRAMSSIDFKCDSCDKMFNKPQFLSAHKKPHLRDGSKNSVMASSVVAGSSNQSRDKIAKAEQKPFECNICKKEYSSKSAFYGHKRLHSGVGLSGCHIQDAKFITNGRLTVHLRAHRGEKPYQCETCGAKFATSSQLTSHMRVHIGEKTFQCDTCDARYTQRYNLTRHMRLHTGKKPYQCALCHARFTESGSFATHMRVHTGEKPYQCDTCHARFTQNRYLTQHMRVHTGEKPFQCDRCHARFTQSGNLTKHMRVHMGETPFQCDTCDARFVRSSCLTKHLRVHMGEKCDVSPTSVIPVM